jgi:hypothetical protein
VKRPYLKKKMQKDWAMAQVAEHLPGMHEALGSILSEKIKISKPERG